MALRLNQTLFGHFHNFWATIAPAQLAGWIDCWSNVLLLSLCPGFSFCSLQRAFPQKGDNIRVKARSLYQLEIRMFCDGCGHCPWRWGPTVSLQRETLCLSIILVVYGSPQDPLANSSTECNPVRQLVELPGSKTWPI